MANLASMLIESWCSTVSPRQTSSHHEASSATSAVANAGQAALVIHGAHCHWTVSFPVLSTTNKMATIISPSVALSSRQSCADDDGQLHTSSNGFTGFSGSSKRPSSGQSAGKEQHRQPFQEGREGQTQVVRLQYLSRSAWKVLRWLASTPETEQEMSEKTPCA